MMVSQRVTETRSRQRPGASAASVTSPSPRFTIPKDNLPGEIGWNILLFATLWSDAGLRCRIYTSITLNPFDESHLHSSERASPERPDLAVGESPVSLCNALLTVHPEYHHPFIVVCCVYIC
jgi:hypothetical protein